MSRGTATGIVIVAWFAMLLLFGLAGIIAAFAEHAA